MERDRLSIHIWSDAEITVEERKNCIKTVKRITMNDFIHCIQDSSKDFIPIRNIVLPKNALFHSFSNESNKFSAALEYPYDRADITYMKTVYRNFPLPRLVFGFKVNADGYIQQVCLGVAKNCRILREDTPMYHYPFSNVLKNFSLCTGGNLLPEIKKIHALSYMPDYILGLPNNDDYFQHKNNKLHLSHRELMEHLADKSPEYYYSDVLIPSGKTLADFYEAVSL